MPDTFVKIASVTVGAGGAASIDFTSIPSTYTDLCVSVSGRASSGGNLYENLAITLNSDTGANYSRRYLRGNGSTADSYSGTGNVAMYASNTIVGSSATASTFSSISIYIPNYASSNQKSVSIDGVTENNAATAYANLGANLWSGTAAITNIKLAVDGLSWAQYSTATLYGIKNS